VISLSDPSDAPGVHRNTIYRIVKSNRANASTVRKPAKILDVTPIELVGEETRKGH
jgi:hypothetical protein